VEDLESKVSTLTTSLTTGIIWIVILSLALVIVGAISFKRWRKDCGQKRTESETSSNVDNWETASYPESVSHDQAEAKQEDVFVDVDLDEPAKSSTDL
jgi:thiol:disulfide interchange protein